MRANLLVSLVMTSVAISAGSARSDVFVGVAAPAYGPLKAYGDQLRVGVEAAIRDLNMAGGVLGQQLVLQSADDFCEPDQATAAANQFAGAGVALVVGHACSAASLAAAPSYDGRVISITPSSTATALTATPRPGLFRLIGQDDDQGRTAALLLVEYFREKVAIIHDNSVYGQSLAKTIIEQMKIELKKDEAKKLNDPIAYSMNLSAGRYYMSGPNPFSVAEAAKKALSMSPEAVFLIGLAPDMVSLAAALRGSPSNPLIIGSDGLAVLNYASADGTLMTFQHDPRTLAPATAVVDQFRQDKIEPAGYVLTSYAAVQAWAQAVKLAGTIAFKETNAELQKGTFPTVLGDVTFDKSGNWLGANFELHRWEGGDYSSFTPVCPPLCPKPAE